MRFRRFARRGFRRRPRMFKRQWLKVGVTPGTAQVLTPASSAYNNGGGDAALLLHRFPILGDVTPAVQASGPTYAQTPRDLRDNLRVTAVRGYIFHQAPALSNDVGHSIYRVIEGIIKINSDDAAGWVAQANSGNPVSPSDTRFADQRWLWRRELFCNLMDNSADIRAGQTNSDCSLLIIPESKNLVEFEPKVVCSENETLFYMCFSEVRSWDGTSNHGTRTNSEVAFKGSLWLDLRVLSWART